MNNLTQTRINNKRAFLDRQQGEMLVRYEQVNTKEREAIVNHIDSFLSACSSDQKIFWQTFKQKLKSLDELTDLFPLGITVLTVGAKEALEESGQEPTEFLSRHQRGDWGIVCKEDSDENFLSLKEGFRIFSVYKAANDVKIWCITEADRSSTTILLPSEY